VTRQLFRMTRRLFNRWPNKPMAGYMCRFSLANQRALNTGASRGLGAKVAAVFADARPCAA
jgi:hypothetical protein